MSWGSDNPFFQPRSSFNQPVDPPSTDPDAGTQMTVCFGVEWLPYILGALEQLLLSAAWNGTTADKILAQQRALLLMELFYTPVCAPSMIPTPYWEDNEDDEGHLVPADQQNWYGVLTSEVWYEQLSDWLLAAFIAYALSPTAAVQYVMYIPRARLAFRQHDLGSLVKIFLDGTQVYSGDTYSVAPGVLYVDLQADVLTGHAPPYTVWVAQASASQLQVIRHQLDANDVYPSTQRYDSTNDVIQYTPDGGTTWIDSPQFDPRHNSGYALPPVGGSDPRCQAAANATVWVENFISGTLGALAEASDGLSIVTFLVSLFIELGPFAILVDVVVTLAGILFSAGITALSAAFTTSVYQTLQCIFYCDFETDGTCTAGDLANIEADVSSQIGGLVSTVLDAMFLVMGENGLTNAGTMGSNPADCSGCTSCGYCTTDFNELDVSALCPTAICPTTPRVVSTNTGTEIDGSTGNGNLSTASDVVLFARWPIPSGYKVTEAHATMSGLANRSGGGWSANIYRSGSTTPLVSYSTFPANTPESFNLDISGLSVTDPYIYFECALRGVTPVDNQYAQMTAFEICVELV